MLYNNTVFYKSVADLKDLPPDSNIEIAFAGRSNAGKSSALNAIVAKTMLAKTSKTPGRTQLINFFIVSDNKFLVDLPGYGYAKVSAATKKLWQERLSTYIETRKSLRGIILIMDIRHPLKDLDWQMLEWCQYQQLKIHILLTKADKLSKSQSNQTLIQVKRALETFGDTVSLQKFSAPSKQGVAELLEVLNSWFTN